MLEQIHIRNFVLIPNLELDLDSGFTVLTGETGSGKSIILGALSLLLGGKADKDSIRLGADSAEISGVFSSSSRKVLDYLDGLGVSHEDGRILIRRVVRSSGRNHYSVNGMGITLAEGAGLADLLVDLTGQHSNQTLLKHDAQLLALDRSAGNLPVLEEYSARWTELKELERRKAGYEARLEKAVADREYNEFCFNELEKAALEVGEDERLKAELDIASSAEFLSEQLSIMKAGLEKACESLSDCLSVLKRCMRKDPGLSAFESRLESDGIDVEDLRQEVSSRLSSYSFDPYELEEKNSRLALIQRLKKKYGGSIERALEKKDELSSLLALADDSEQCLRNIDEEIGRHMEGLLAVSDRLHQNRVAAAARLSKQITGVLNTLAMDQAVFEIEISPAPLCPTGRDSVRFMIAANKGEKKNGIENTASGGELSRLMLALKSVLGDEEDVSTMVFDEIDAGIGGLTASNIAGQLGKLSKDRQILVITHLAQIASRADHHLLVSKSVVSGRTETTVIPIDGEDRVSEIARLLSGNVNDISLRHARSLLEVKG